MLIGTKFTHADLLVIPSDGKRREIIDGELIVTPSPLLFHQRILRRLVEEFYRYLQHHPIGELIVSPMDVIFSELDVLEPDLLFVLNEHREILKDWVRGVPDLVIEILSPTTAANDRGPKLKSYARYGVTEYWIADPGESTIDLYRLTSDGYELSRMFRLDESVVSSLLPGFALPLRRIFEF